MMNIQHANLDDDDDLSDEDLSANPIEGRFVIFNYLFDWRSFLEASKGEKRKNLTDDDGPPRKV